ncbi:MAG: TraR/DksA C4-type zinc finger protein [Abditibacteriota bacterium]|nr:TraR/DksA C4-type zinc finger protein [Abditibacteriota bacterium]
MNEYKEKLLSELERIENERKILAGTDVPAGAYPDAPEVLPIEDDYDKAEAEVRAALERIEDGVYGVCAKCGKPIAPARLRILPVAELCLSCAEEEEE